MMRDWEATCGFVEVRNKNMMTWSLMFARMDKNTLYFYEDESESKALFAVQFNSGFSVEALPTGNQFEIRNNNLEEIRAPVTEEDGEDGEEKPTTATDTSFMSNAAHTGKAFLKKFGRQIFASGNTLTVSVADSGNLEMWMITIIQAIEGVVRESERFEGRLSVVDTVGRSLSGDQPSSALATLQRDTVDHLVTGPLKKATPAPITQAAINALTNTVRSLGVTDKAASGDTSVPQTLAAPAAIWEDMWCELRCEPTGLECTFAMYSWPSVLNRFLALKGQAPDVEMDKKENERIKNLHSGSMPTAPSAADSNNTMLPPSPGPSNGTAAGFNRIPWVSPHGFSGSDKTSKAWTEYRHLWSTVEGYDGSAGKARPIPRPSGDAQRASIKIKATTSVKLLPSSLGERYGFAVINPAEGGIRIAAPTEEAQIAWIGYLEEAIMSAKAFASSNQLNNSRRQSSSGGAAARAIATAAANAQSGSGTESPKSKVPMRRLSGVKTGRRSFTGNFDGVVQGVLKESEDAIPQASGDDERSKTAEDNKKKSKEPFNEREKQEKQERERKFVPRASLRMSLAKASGRRSSIQMGKFEVTTEKVDSMTTAKKAKVINFEEVIGAKADGSADGRAVRRDYTQAAGVIKRASKDGATSLPQKHLPKFKPTTVIVNEDDTDGAAATAATATVATAGMTYMSPAERERQEEETKKEREEALKKEMARLATMKQKQVEERIRRKDEEDAEAEAAMKLDEGIQGRDEEKTKTVPVDGTFDDDSEGSDSSDESDDDDLKATTYQIKSTSDGTTPEADSPRAVSAPAPAPAPVRQVLSPLPTPAAAPAPAPAPAPKKTVNDGSWSLFGGPKGPSVGKKGEDLEKDTLYYMTYFCKDVGQNEDAPLVEEGDEILVTVWQNQRFVPIVGFSRQNLFLVRDPPALSDVTGHLRFPSVSLEYAIPPEGYKWADSEDGSNWCISDDRVDVLELERELTPDEKRAKALKESLEAGLELASKVNFEAAGSDDELSSDDSSGDEAEAAKKKKGVRDDKTWSGDIRDWEEGWVYAHAFHRFAVHRKTKAYHFSPGIKDIVRRRRIERRCVKIKDNET